jgi:transglutaminase-like putative cysteine protease
MKLLPYSLSFSLLFLFFVQAAAQHKKPLIGKEPSWITKNQYNYTDSRLDHEAEDGYFDIAYEQQVSLAQQSFFRRKSIKILTEAGIQNSSEVSVSFDPSYEQLTFHTIRIIRGNTIIDQLNLSKIKTIQQEKQLDRYLYNGSLSSVLFLEDVRKGDIIEYSYTIKGLNPIFRGKYADIYDMDFMVPVGCLYYKLIIPKGRQVSIKNNNTGIHPNIIEEPADIVYEWKAEQVKPLRLQDNIPSWYDPYSIVMVSEYKSWKEVNDWAMGLFPVVKTVSPGLQKKIDEIKASYADQEKQAAAAIRFVQDDVRYMGIEMGEGSHKPGYPDKIFSQRFGDCKDKSYLLSTILRRLGMESYPVLINTSAKKSITERLPSATCFDHVTVFLKLNNKEYWFDPTISFQRGPLDLISYPDYQYGLIIQPGNDHLTMINKKEPGMMVVKEIFDIPDMSGKARLTVTSRYTGSFADDMRSGFNNSSNYEMQKSFRDYYANFYDQITADSIHKEDDENNGLFITKEYYSIEGLWKLEGGVKKASFDPYVIDGIIKRPKDTRRKMPFKLTWPAKYKEDVEINLPEDWSADQSFNKIDNSSFNMTARFSHDGRRTIYLEYAYENLKDHVNADELNTYIQGLDERDKEFSYVLSYDMDGQAIVAETTPNKKKNNNNYYLGFFLVLVIGGIVWWTQRK